MADDCERCGEALADAGNHLELEVSGDHLARDLCDGCARAVAAVLRRPEAEIVVDLSDVHGEA